MISLPLWFLPALFGSIGLIMSIRAKNKADKETRQLKEEKEKLEKEIKSLEAQTEKKQTSLIAWTEKRERAIKKHKAFMNAHNNKLACIQNEERKIKNAEKKKCPICKQKKRDCCCPKNASKKSSTLNCNQY